MNLTDAYEKVIETFNRIFGRTPLRIRIDDILREALELSRYTDLTHLKEETGDLLASTLKLCEEAGWNPADLVMNSLRKIEERADQYKTLGRKLNVAILGSAQDPTTLGHIDVCKLVLNASKTFDEVWIMPCYQHMSNKHMESPEHRLKMAQIASQADGRIRVCSYEIDNKFRGESYHMLRKLIEDVAFRDKYNFSLIIGMDNANTFHTWVNAEELERLVRFVVVPRQGVKPDPKVDWYLRPPHIYLSNYGADIRETHSYGNICTRKMRMQSFKVIWTAKFSNTSLTMAFIEIKV